MENAKNTTPPQHAPSDPLPTWITPALIERTRAVWQPYVDHILSDDEAIEMIKTVGALCDVLFEPDPLDNRAVLDPLTVEIKTAA
jgi:hypothetical protein